MTLSRQTINGYIPCCMGALAEVTLNVQVHALSPWNKPEVPLAVLGATQKQYQATTASQGRRE